MNMLVQMRNIPNILTWLRILVVPLIIYLFYVFDEYEASIYAAILFTLACFTDFLDGYLSRKYHLTSDFGAMLDPIADKILVVAILFILVSLGRISIVPAIIICGREFLVSGLRDYLSSKNIALPVTKLAKWKTFSQMLAMFLFLLGEQIEILPYQPVLADLLLWLAILLTIITSLFYIEKAGRLV